MFRIETGEVVAAMEMESDSVFSLYTTLWDIEDSWHDLRFLQLARAASSALKIITSRRDPRFPCWNRPAPGGWRTGFCQHRVTGRVCEFAGQNGATQHRHSLTRCAWICAAPFSHARHTITWAGRAEENSITSGLTNCSKSAYFILISS